METPDWCQLCGVDIPVGKVYCAPCKEILGEYGEDFRKDNEVAQE